MIRKKLIQNPQGFTIVSSNKLEDLIYFNEEELVETELEHLISWAKVRGYKPLEMEGSEL